MSNVPTPSTPSDHYENQSVQLLRRIAGEPFMPASAPTALTKYEKYKAEENRLLGEIAEIIAGATSWIGVTTTALTDGAAINPITINGESVTAVAGNITSYGADEFIFNGSVWQKFGGEAPGLPAGGTQGQFLVKNSSTNYDASWVTVPDAATTAFGGT